MAKKNGVEFILIDSTSGVTWFNLLRLYDAIEWSKTGSLRSEIRNRPLRVQGVGLSGAAGNIQFGENGENFLGMSTLVELGWSMQLATLRYSHPRMCITDAREILYYRTRSVMLAAEKHP